MTLPHIFLARSSASSGAVPYRTLRQSELPPTQPKVLDDRLRHCPSLILGEGSAQSPDRCSGQGKSDVESQVILRRPAPWRSRGGSLIRQTLVLGPFLPAMPHRVKHPA